jgi:hypothetical protein
MKNHSVAALLCILFHLVVLFPSSIRSQQPKPSAPHNNTICTKATSIPSNVTLPYIDNPTTAFHMAEFSRKPNMVFANCSDINWRSTRINVQFAWYKWKPNSSGFHDIIAIDNSFDGDIYRISVLQGPTCETLDSAVLLCPKLSSHRGVYFEKGMNYYFSIILRSPTRQTSPTGGFTFTIKRTSPPLSNDECYNAIRIPSSLTLPYTTSESDVTGATINRNSELIPTCDPNYKIDRRTVQRFGTVASYWYVWTPSRTGYYKLDVTQGTTSGCFNCGFDVPPTVAVYENDTSFNCNRTSTWKQVACTGNRITASITEFVAGQTYYIQVLPQINFVLDKDFNPLKNVMLTIQPSQAPPINDLCINAIPIDPNNGLNIISPETTYASADVYIDPNEQLFCDTGNSTPFNATSNGIWYKYDHTIGAPYLSTTFCNSQKHVYLLRGNNDCSSLQCFYRHIPSRCPSTFHIIPEENTSYYILIEDSNRAKPFQVSITKNYFKMINAITDTSFADNFSSLATYQSINSQRGEIPLDTTKLNIEAYFHPEYGVNSVFVTFDNPFRSKCERKYPFSIFGDRNGDFYNATIPLGSHSVTATPYTGSDCKGIIPTTPLKQNFTVTGCDILFFLVQLIPFGERVIYLNNHGIRLPCDARLTTSLQNCLDPKFPIEKVQLKIIDTITNTSVKGDTLYDIDGDKRISFGQRNDSAPYHVNPFIVPPSTYAITYTLDNIEHQSTTLFTIQSSCVP